MSDAVQEPPRPDAPAEDAGHADDGARESAPVFSKGVLLFLLLLPLALFVAARFTGPARSKGVPHEMPKPLEVLGVVTDFELTDQDGRAVSFEKDLKGRIWVADFIFTRCGGPCPTMTRKMRELQDSLKVGWGVHLVTFTVDPEFDTPEVLKRYASNNKADTATWTFLTGERKAIYDMAQNNFRMSTFHSDQGIITHSSRLVLIDTEGRIRASHVGMDGDAVSLMRQDIETLLMETKL